MHVVMGVTFLVYTYVDLDEQYLIVIDQLTGMSPRDDHYPELKLANRSIFQVEQGFIGKLDSDCLKSDFHCSIQETTSSKEIVVSLTHRSMSSVFLQSFTFKDDDQVFVEIDEVYYHRMKPGYAQLSKNFPSFYVNDEGTLHNYFLNEQNDFPEIFRIDCDLNYLKSRSLVIYNEKFTDGHRNQEKNEDEIEIEKELHSPLTKSDFETN